MTKVLHRSIRKGIIIKQDESGANGLIYSIVRSTGAPPVLVRNRGPRDFDEIPPSELQIIAWRLADDGDFEPGSDAHIRAILDFFDLKRLTAHVNTTLLDILSQSYPHVDEIVRNETADR
jgi:hypothetical protein